MGRSSTPSSAALAADEDEPSVHAHNAGASAVIQVLEVIFGKQYAYAIRERAIEIALAREANRRSLSRGAERLLGAMDLRKAVAEFRDHGWPDTATVMVPHERPRHGAHLFTVMVARTPDGE